MGKMGVGAWVQRWVGGFAQIPAFWAARQGGGGALLLGLGSMKGSEILKPVPQPIFVKVALLWGVPMILSNFRN